MIPRKGSAMDKETHRIEKKEEVEAYIAKIIYALGNSRAQIIFQKERKSDQNRDPRYTNKYTVAELFPNEAPEKALKRELKKLSVREYIDTVKDNDYPDRSEMRVFGRVYPESKEVYIKIRVELMKLDCDHEVFVMSFHFAEYPLSEEMFPYKGDAPRI